MEFFSWCLKCNTKCHVDWIGMLKQELTQAISSPCAFEARKNDPGKQYDINKSGESRLLYFFV
jgi:hypothetical protein